jgi:hypothetical protein
MDCEPQLMSGDYAEGVAYEAQLPFADLLVGMKAFLCQFGAAGQELVQPLSMRWAFEVQMAPTLPGSRSRCTQPNKSLSASGMHLVLSD